MVERVLPFFTRRSGAPLLSRLPIAWPDNLPLCWLSSSAKDVLPLADAKIGVLINGKPVKEKPPWIQNEAIVGALVGASMSVAGFMIMKVSKKRKRAPSTTSLKPEKRGS